MDIVERLRVLRSESSGIDVVLLEETIAEVQRLRRELQVKSDFLDMLYPRREDLTTPSKES